MFAANTLPNAEMDRSSDLSTVIELHQPPLNELRDVIQDALEKNFQHASTVVEMCPDTTKSPFNMTSTGFGKNLRIAEVGGPGNLFPVIHKEKEFDLKNICQTCDLSNGSVFGPGAGPWPVVGSNCEMVADANLKLDKFATKIAKIDESSAPGYKMDVINSSKFSLMANLAISESDENADVVHFKCSVRTGETNLPETIRRAVAAKYGQRPVSLAGVFVLQEGQGKFHVMPGFPGCPWKETKEIDSWLRYFTMSGPIVCATVFHSFDPGHELRMEHTHCYSEHGDAGHYHYDVTPETVVYEGWLAPAEKIYRIDEI